MGEHFIDRLLESTRRDVLAVETCARHAHVKTVLRLAQARREHVLVLAGLRKAGRAATRLLGAAARVLTLGVRILSAGRPDPAGALLPRDL